MSESTLTHKDLASLLGVSETTVKSYRRKFPGCIPVANKGKPIRFTADAAKVALRIRDLFETGMSVDEVRARLAAEFAWISPQSPVSAKGPSPKSGDRAEIGPELSLGVSNMAKSLVAMTQQQKAILSRIQSLESLLEDLGLGEHVSEEIAEGLTRRTDEARQRREFIDNRLAKLDDLDSKVEQLADNVRDLAGQLDRFLARRVKAAEEWRQTDAGASAAAGMATVREAFQDDGVGQKDVELDRGSDIGAVNGPVTPNTGETAMVIPLRSAGNEPGVYARNAIRQGGEAVPVPPAIEEPQEPPRRFFALPLVARTEQGKYISAAGRSRGPFSLNDLKAMLIYGFTPPNHFTLRWENHGQGWWLFLEQESGEKSLHLLLMELPTQKGGSVAEILQIVCNGDTMHPAEFSGIIDSFSS